MNKFESNLRHKAQDFKVLFPHHPTSFNFWLKKHVKVSRFDCKVPDDGLRWDIDCLFSDFKSRSFCITKAPHQACRPYGAPDSGPHPCPLLGRFHRHAASERQAKPLSKKAYRSMTSFFKRGLGFLLQAPLSLLNIPKLWQYKNDVGW